MEDAGANGAHLLVGSVDGPELRLTVSDVGDGLRIAVGSLNERASIWRVTASRNDVFIAARGMDRTMKVSLHESGVWRQAYLTPEHAAASGATGLPQFNNDPRVLDRWEQPEGVSGWMHALSVWVPHGHLTPLPDELENPRKPIRWVSGPGPGELVGLHFAMVRPDEGVLRLEGAAVVDGFALPNGRALIVLTSREPIEEARMKWARDMSTALLVMSQGGEVTVTGDPYRMGLFSTVGEDGRRICYDLRAPSLKDLEALRGQTLTVSRTFHPDAN